MDADFDGFISKEDLRLFLFRVLKYGEESIPSSYIDRLFKLLDNFKRGFI